MLPGPMERDVRASTLIRRKVRNGYSWRPKVATKRLLPCLPHAQARGTHDKGRQIGKGTADGLGLFMTSCNLIKAEALSPLPALSMTGLSSERQHGTQPLQGVSADVPNKMAGRPGSGLLCRYASATCAAQAGTGVLCSGSLAVEWGAIRMWVESSTSIPFQLLMITPVNLSVHSIYANGTIVIPKQG